MQSMHTHNIRIGQCDQCIYIISELVNAYTYYMNWSMRSMHIQNIRISQCNQCMHIISELVNAINAYTEYPNQSMQSMHIHIDKSVNATNAYTYR